MQNKNLFCQFDDVRTKKLLLYHCINKATTWLHLTISEPPVYDLNSQNRITNNSDTCFDIFRNPNRSHVHWRVWCRRLKEPEVPTCCFSVQCSRESFLKANRNALYCNSWLIIHVTIHLLHHLHPDMKTTTTRIILILSFSGSVCTAAERLHTWGRHRQWVWPLTSVSRVQRNRAGQTFKCLCRYLNIFKYKYDIISIVTSCFLLSDTPTVTRLHEVAPPDKISEQKQNKTL